MTPARTTPLAGAGRRNNEGVHRGQAPRVRCAEHGVVVAHVPWARHGAGHTLAFDQAVAWLVTQCSKTAVTRLIASPGTVGAVITRVWADVGPSVTAWTGCGASASTRSPTARHRFLTWWSITTRADCCGPHRAGTGRPCVGSAIYSAPNAAPRARISRSGRLGRDRGRALPERGAVRRPVPRGQVGHRGPRRNTT